jgi:hypothetical protein
VWVRGGKHASEKFRSLERGGMRNRDPSVRSIGRSGDHLNDVYEYVFGGGEGQFSALHPTRSVLAFVRYGYWFLNAFK